MPGKPVQTPTPGLSPLVRITHWLTVIAVAALLVSGIEVTLSHPRFYLGETGNVNTPPLFSLHLPSSRDTVPTGYHFVLPDANGWARFLHFQAAWLLLFTGAAYLAYGLQSGHFRRRLLPPPGTRNRASLLQSVRAHLRPHRSGSPDAEDLPGGYNLLQRLTYLLVIFGLFPLLILTGLCMSPAFAGAAPFVVAALGGRQTARTLHFLLTGGLVLFVVVHVVMVARSGFRERMRAITLGPRRTVPDTAPAAAFHPTEENA